MKSSYIQKYLHSSSKTLLQSLKNKQFKDGFTIVELLIVIVVIGILAAITIVAYNGIQQRANLANLKIDMSSAAKTLENANTSGGAYPATLTIAALRSSPGTTYQYTYTSSGNTYCLTGTNNGVAYTVSTATPTPAVGVCPGHTPPVVLVNNGVVTTFAGSGATGLVDGPGVSAMFLNPIGLAVDASGTIYVADPGNNSIRKITTAGVVSTFAGSTQGSANGTGTGAQFYRPYGVVVDASGTVYVTDTYNNLIRKITSAGVVTTLAGSGALGFADGTGASAVFRTPIGLTIDTSGNLYVADNNRIRMISTSTGVVTTFAGSGVAGFADGTGSSAQFNTPWGIAIDTSGNFYVSDYNNNRIRKLTSAGVVTTLAGSGVAGFADGTGSGAQFNNPFGVAIDSSGTIYVGDGSNMRVRKVTSAGIVTTLAGSGVQGFADGTGTSAQFNAPYGITVDSSGAVYVADYTNNRIRKIQ